MKRITEDVGFHPDIIAHALPVLREMGKTALGDLRKERPETVEGCGLLVTYDPENSKAATVLHLGKEAVSLTWDQTEALAQLLYDLLDGEIT